MVIEPMTGEVLSKLAENGNVDSEVSHKESEWCAIK